MKIRTTRVVKTTRAIGTEEPSLQDYFGSRPTEEKTDGTWYLEWNATCPIGETGFHKSRL